MINIDFISGFLIALVIGGIGCYIINKRWTKKVISMKEYHDNFVHVVENTTDFIYYFNIPEMKFKYLSPSAEQFFGEGSNADAYQDSEVAFRDIHPDDYEVLINKINGNVDFNKPIIQRWKDKDGKYRAFEEYATPTYENGMLVALQGVLRNIDERIALEEKIEYQLYHDSLTNLYNRQYFDKLVTKLDDCKNEPVGIILCDLDNLKMTNDTYGHKCGDDLIKSTANLLNTFNNDTTIVARIGGDEFILVKTAIEYELLDMSTLVDEIEGCIENYNDEKPPYKINLSIGFSSANHSLGNMTALISEADHSMYRNKSQKKSNYKQLSF